MPECCTYSDVSVGYIPTSRVTGVECVRIWNFDSCWQTDSHWICPNLLFTGNYLRMASVPIILLSDYMIKLLDFSMLNF